MILDDYRLLHHQFKQQEATKAQQQQQLVQEAIVEGSLKSHMGYQEPWQRAHCFLSQYGAINYKKYKKSISTITKSEFLLFTDHTMMTQ